MQSRGVFPASPSVKGLVPDAEPPYLQDNVASGKQCDAAFHEGLARSNRAEVSVDDHQNAFNKLYSDDVVASLAGDLVCNNRKVW